MITVTRGRQSEDGPVEPTRIWLGDTEITDYVTSVQLERVTFEPQVPLRPVFPAWPVTIQISYTVANPTAYRLLTGRRHPRLRALRSAYRRKSKGWR
jgi:hypothetical protein